jgi:hypothetical protein
VHGDAVEVPLRAAAVVEIVQIGVAGDRFAFVEQNERVFGVGGWRLWYISSPGQSAVELDRGGPQGGMVTPPPTLAIDDGHLVWATFHQGASGPRSVLRVKDLATGAVRELEDSPFEQIQYWFPAINGENVVFGTVEGDDWHIRLGRLDGGWRTRQLDQTGHAATPAISGNTIVWKHGGASVFDWGTLVRYSIGDNEEHAISLGPQAAINYPSMGDRYVAVWGRDDTKFYLYDFRNDRVVRLSELAPTSTTAMVHPTAGGSVVTLILGSTSPDGGELQLQWAATPP